MKARLLCILILAACSASAQNLGNLHYKYISTRTDSVSLDSLSIIPNSLFITDRNGIRLDTVSYRIDYAKSTLLWYKDTKTTTILKDSLKVIYRVFPYSFSKSYQRKSLKAIEKSGNGFYNPFTYNGEGKKNAELFKFDGLNKNGSISRGISFGNNQDVVVNSSLNLQLSGKLSDDIDVLAAITDENIPFQPEGNTQQIQEFDKVFIQFSRNSDKLIVGDFETRNPDGYFMKYYKKGQGLSYSGLLNLGEKKKSGTMKISAAGAISKGKFGRNLLEGIEGNQGPYRLKGNNNETFIIILSGSEKVYLNGRKLERGQQNDYIIDYNTAEVTFMPKNLITKDSRLVFEFEYSDKNYSRTMFTFGNEYENKNLKLHFNAFSEQDAKNQPLVQSLSDAQKQILSDKGDSLDQALSPNIDSVAFSPDEVLYKKVLAGSETIYVYSTSRDSAHYRLGFSLVGAGKGDYSPKTSSANGKVYEYAGKGKGAYLPITRLISPRSQQLYTLGADYQLSAASAISTEVALSNNDINLFSAKDKNDDKGLAFKTDFSNLKALQKTGDDPWKLRTSLHLERSDKNFRFLERYRPTEFERDWNISQNVKPDNEFLSGALLDLSRKSTGSVSYQFRTFLRGSDYTGLQHNLNTSLHWKDYKFNSAASLLSTKSTDVNSSYIRHREDISRKIHKFVIGAREEQEINRFSRNGADTLERNSFTFYEWQAYITNLDTAANRFAFNYTQRYDYLPKKNDFSLATVARTFSFTSDLKRNPNSHFSSTSAYRKLEVLDPLSGKQSETSLVNRFDYNLSLLRGGLNSSTYYQIATGQELKKDYTFLEVARGKGTYIWNDYNHNGIKEKNEYELAVYQDTARFVKILVPSNDYVKTNSNDFNEVLYIAPAAFLQNPKGYQKVITRFSNQSAVQLSRKTLKKPGVSELDYLNPFSQRAEDSSLITTQSSLRNVLYFNRTQSSFGFDLNWQSTQNKLLLTDGFELRTLRDYGSNIRWDISRSFNQVLTLRNGKKKSSSQYFTNRNYDIQIYEMEPKLNFQPINTFRLTFDYKLSSKTNEAKADNPEKVTSSKYGIEVKVNTLKTGSLQLRISIVKVNYNAEENTPLSYEMLEGLKNGTNITWGFSFQRSLSNNTQLNINYDGRKSEGAGPVHTGGVQLRAFF